VELRHPAGTPATSTATAPPTCSPSPAAGLNLYSNPTAGANGLPAPTNTSASNASPDATDGANWSTFAITHRGSVTQQGDYDDLWALGGSHHTLYLYQNNPPSHGAAPQYGNTAWVNPVTYLTCSATASNCTGYPPSWSSYTQILSPGDAWTGSSSDTGVPSLLAIDGNGRLWAFQGQFGNALANPIQLAASGWTGMTLIAPGQVDGQLQIWARNNTTGALNAYTISIDGNQLPALSVPTPIPSITLKQAPGHAWRGDQGSREVTKGRFLL
jgi:hypothetical protein